MSAIVNTSFSAGFFPQISSTPPSELKSAVTQKDFSSTREIRDTANLSEMSKKLNTSGDNTPTPASIVMIKDNLAAVKTFISVHNEEALDQQANQSSGASLSLICGMGV